MTATTCRMKSGTCPGNPGHRVMMDCDHFYCSSCGDTAHRPCSCADCPDRPENRQAAEEQRQRDEELAEAALDLALHTLTNGTKPVDYGPCIHGPGDPSRCGHPDCGGATGNGSSAPEEDHG